MNEEPNESELRALVLDFSQKQRARAAQYLESAEGTNSTEVKRLLTILAKDAERTGEIFPTLVPPLGVESESEVGMFWDIERTGEIFPMLTPPAPGVGFQRAEYLEQLGALVRMVIEQERVKAREMAHERQRAMVQAVIQMEGERDRALTDAVRELLIAATAAAIAADLGKLPSGGEAAGPVRPLAEGEPH